MKLKVVDIEGHPHKRILTETDVVIGIFHLDESGFFYFEPLGTGWYEAHTLRQIAVLLDKINKPYNDKLKEEFRLKEGDKVIVKNDGNCYSTYHEMFKKLGFKRPHFPKHYFDYSDRGAIFTIFATGYHFDGTYLLAIRDAQGVELLFGEKGLRRYEEPDYNIDPMTGIVYPKEN